MKYLKKLQGETKMALAVEEHSTKDPKFVQPKGQLRMKMTRCSTAQNQTCDKETPFIQYLCLP